ncbi:hypothetical protein [Natrinema sp. H-ect4]|uniref:hypothetical protein n=1 Tax=Natrinema sp. H-ect4 TaxID=3242699 RepID=UPI0035A92D64
MNTRSLGTSVIRFGAIAVIVSALFVFLNQVLDVSWQILTSAVIAVILLILGWMWKRGFFLSPWSLQLRSLYRKYSYSGFVPLLRVFKSRERRRVEVLKGLFLVAAAVIVGVSIYLLHSTLLNDFTLNVQSSVLGRAWQVHAVIIGFSFVALTFVWEEIYSNSLSDELTRLFVEDIGSIWTVTFVFGSNLLLGVIAFTQSSVQNVGLLPVYVTAVLFVSSIVSVAGRFLDALDLLFYTDLDEEVKEYAKADLEKDLIRESSTPNQVLSETIHNFEQISIGMPNFGLEQTTISSRDLDKTGVITDINLKRMENVSEIVDREPATSIRKNPTVGMSLAEDTTVLSLEGDIDDETVEELTEQLRRGLRPRREN